MHWLSIQLASVVDICSDPNVRAPLNTAVNVGTFAAALAILRQIRKGSVTVGDTTISIQKDKSES